MNAHQNYDAIVIGGSAASVGHLCPYLAQAGWRTALVERAHLGGTCVNVGCMPTKTMAASARVSHVVSVAGAYGVQTASVNVDMARVQQRTQDLVLRLRKSEADVIEKAGVDLIRGEARFTAPKSLEVRLTEGSTCQLSASAIVIDTGARPARLTIPGLATVPALDPPPFSIWTSFLILLC